MKISHPILEKQIEISSSPFLVTTIPNGTTSPNFIRLRLLDSLIYLVYDFPKNSAKQISEQLIDNQLVKPIFYNLFY